MPCQFPCTAVHNNSRPRLRRSFTACASLYGCSEFLVFITDRQLTQALTYHTHRCFTAAVTGYPASELMRPRCSHHGMKRRVPHCAKQLTPPLNNLRGATSPLGSTSLSDMPFVSSYRERASRSQSINGTGRAAAPAGHHIQRRLPDGCSAPAGITCGMVCCGMAMACCGITCGACTRGATPPA